MRRGEVWWTHLPGPGGRRPVVLLSRDEAYTARALVTVAPVTTRIRRLPVEVPLGKKDGLPKRCVINLDIITTIPTKDLAERIVLLSGSKLAALDGALRFALGLDD